MNWSILLVTASLFVLTCAACAGGGAKSTPELRVYTVRLEVVDQDNLAVNGVNVAGGDIFGSTAQGGILERSMVDEGQFRRHMDVTYQVEKFACVVEQQQVRIDEKNDNFVTITLQLACNEPRVRLDESTALLFDGENIWVANVGGGVTKVALDGTLLGTFPVGHPSARLAFDGENPWLAANRAAVTLTKLGQALGNIWDSASGGDGIWLAGSCGVAKISMDGRIVLGPFPTLVCGGFKKIIFDGQYIWVLEHPNNGTSLVSRLNSDGQILRTFPVGFAAAGDLVFDGEGVWVLASEDPTESPTALWRIEP